MKFAPSAALKLTAARDLEPRPKPCLGTRKSVFEQKLFKVNRHLPVVFTDLYVLVEASEQKVESLLQVLLRQDLLLLHLKINR